MELDILNGFSTFSLEEEEELTEDDFDDSEDMDDIGEDDFDGDLEDDDSYSDDEEEFEE